MADDTLQTFLTIYGQSEAADGSNIPHHRSNCCCGNPACAYLRQNQASLDDLEQDVRHAAKLGQILCWRSLSMTPQAALKQSSGIMSLMEFSLQALLVRHESYMKDAEKERQAMAAHVEELEGQKKGLQTTNESLIEDNRNLLDQLEAVNNAVAESDAHVTSLQATLQSAQQELHKLSRLATRTESLEQQLADFEREQATWHTSLEEKEESEKCATQRWHKAERALAGMQDQLERIERESKEERERHVEVVARTERRRVVERELTSAAGRLKGAAAVKTTGGDAGGTNVVSHFVKDILSDNANLQMGIVELREMLQNSNEEVETLRQQLTLHQPLEESDDSRSQAGERKSNLGDEMSRAASQELHVHHHYHAPPAPANKNATLRRPKKKRYGALTPNHFTPSTSGRSTPRSSISYSTPSSSSTILQHTAVSVPQPIINGNRWSAQSNQTYQSIYSSSGPSSPQSTNYRTSSIYDRVFSDAGHDSSRPTTPDTEEPGSPMIAPSATKRGVSPFFRTSSAPVVHRRGISPGQGRASLESIADVNFEELSTSGHRPASHDAILEENEGEWEEPVDEASSAASPTGEDPHFDLNSTSFYKQPRRRANSHESLLSISGMDIHTLKDRPSQMLISHGGLSSGAVVSKAQAHAARPAITSRPPGNSRSLLSGMAAEQRAASAPKQTVVRKASGWMFGRWGATPEPSVSVDAPAARAASITSGSDKAKDDSQVTPKPMLKLRPPGINQPGPIFGLMPEVKVQHPPIMKKLDQKELKNVLDEV